MFLGPKPILDPNVTTACCQNLDYGLRSDLSVLTIPKQLLVLSSSTLGSVLLQTLGNILSIKALVMIAVFMLTILTFLRGNLFLDITFILLFLPSEIWKLSLCHPRPWRKTSRSACATSFPVRTTRNQCSCSPDYDTQWSPAWCDQCL